MHLTYKKEIKEIIISSKSLLRDAIQNIDKSGLKIVLVVDNKNKLIGTITDGDVRRGLLKGFNLNDRIEKIIHRNPIVVLEEIKKNEVTTLIRENLLQHVPIVNKSHQPVGLHTTVDFKSKIKRKNKIILMTGGLGTRLLPLTKKKPKALINVFGKPMLEHVVLQLKKSGFVNFIFSINYLGNLIKDYFASGEKFNIKIDYVEEKKPLGTAGSLCYLKNLVNQTVIVTNCDVISDIDYGDALDYHIENSGDATMVVRRYETRNPFGVVETSGNQFVSYKEKPVKYENINAGIYIFETNTFKYLEDEKFQDMPDFFMKLLNEGKKVKVYPIFEYWQDLGQKDNNIDTK